MGKKRLFVNIRQAHVDPEFIEGSSIKSDERNSGTYYKGMKFFPVHWTMRLNESGALLSFAAGILLNIVGAHESGILFLLCGASLFLFGRMFSNFSFLELLFLCPTGALFYGLVGTLLFTASGGTLSFFGALLLVVCAGSSAFFFFLSPGTRIVLWKRDNAGMLVVCGLLCCFSFLVFLQSGAKADGTFLLRGYMNGDTATLVSLIERVRILPEALVVTNPFDGNGALEYPVLLHRFAGLLFNAQPFSTWQGVWYSLPLFVAGVVVLLFRLARTLAGKSVPAWALSLGALCILAYSWDAFTYPQSHTYLFGVFLLFVSSLFEFEKARGSMLLPWAIGVYGTALVLLFSNAVLGTAAVGILSVFAALRLFMDRQKTQALLPLVAAGILFLLFLTFPPGQGGIGTLNIATGAFSSVFFFLPLLLLSLFVLRRHRLASSKVLAAASVALFLLCITTLFFSARSIVADNASRFLYLLLLCVWPLPLPFLLSAFQDWRRRVLHYADPLSARLVHYVSGGIAAALLFLPAAASVATTASSLLIDTPRTVSTDEQAAFQWIRTHTSPTAVFVRAPEDVFDNKVVAPLSLPFFTGRAQLRSTYWLSSNDALSEQVRAYFLGARAPAPSGTYLFCGPEQSVCPAHRPAVFQTGSILIAPI